jgi:hypothetical protein
MYFVFRTIHILYWEDKIFARFASYLIGIINFLGANNKKKTIVLTPPVMVLNEGMKNTVLPPASFK